jgi:hypothetical protein
MLKVCTDPSSSPLHPASRGTCEAGSKSDRFARADPDQSAIALSCFSDTESPVQLRLHELSVGADLGKMLE